MWNDLAHTAVLICVLLIFRGGDCLRMIRLSVPSYKMRGEMAVMECDYELEGERLYAVKWYKENEEFYRYVPKARPPQTSYEVEGIRVNLDLSNTKQVALRSVNLKSSGTYKCEVSAEAPSFASASKEAKMEIIFFPSQSPLVAGISKDRYSVGEEIRANCSSPKSYPAPNLDWFINDIRVPEVGLRRHEAKIISPHNLQVSTVTLRLQVLPHYFKNGHMRLKCVASLPYSFFERDETDDGQNVSPLLEQRETSLTVKAGALQLVGQQFTILLLAYLALQV